MVVDRANREYKVITCAKELFTGNVNGQIGVRFADFDVAPIGYDNGKYNQSLSQSEAESHPGWRQFFEGDEDLHKKFTELVYSRSGDRRSSGSEMSFIIPPGSESTPMMFPIYVQGLRNGSRLSGVNGSNVKTSFLLLGKQE